ncbi:MAG TPA: DNA-processing protein DprA [Bacillota bacterium]
MHETELEYWLAWNQVPGVGPSRFYKLQREFGSMKQAWLAKAEELELLIGAKAVAGWRKVKRHWDGQNEFARLERYHFKVYCYPDVAYPANLKQIPDPPPVLYCWGGLEYRDQVAVAVVGTRNPTPVGSFHARELGAQLSRQGLTVVSGMARGIDSFAHQGALETGGRTIAVLGCGLDVVYPPENRKLMESIAGQGAVISEYPLGTPPLAGNFPARNRIISGLSLGVVVVEAARDSGSLITADLALEQGREVFAVPGNIENEGSRGPHKLIREGAVLVENYQDILAELAIPQLNRDELGTVQTSDLTDLEARVYAVLDREPVHIDQIQRKAALTAAEVNFTLTQLELKGIAKRFPGQLYLRDR